MPDGIRFLYSPSICGVMLYSPNRKPTPRGQASGWASVYSFWCRRRASRSSAPSSLPGKVCSAAQRPAEGVYATATHPHGSRPYALVAFDFPAVAQHRARSSGRDRLAFGAQAKILVCSYITPDLLIL